MLDTTSNKYFNRMFDNVSTDDLAEAISEIIIPILASGIFSQDDKNQIEDMKGKDNKVQLFKALYRSRAHNLDVLYNSLQGYQWIRQHLTINNNVVLPNKELIALNGGGDHIKYDDGNAQLLQDGHVPLPMATNIIRKEYVAIVRAGLRELSMKDKDKWLVIHGLTGIGKTVIAAESLRDASIVSRRESACFPSVFWVSIGDNIETRLDSDLASHLISKMQDLVRTIERHSQVKPGQYQSQLPLFNEQSTLADAADQLGVALRSNFPAGLLVLDDLNSTSNYTAIKQFAYLNYHVMVISQHRHVLGQTPQIPKINIDAGFSFDEALECLNCYCNDNVETMRINSWVNAIWTFCQGHPFTLAVIGATVSDDLPDGWENIYNQLTSTKQTSIEAGNINYEHSSFGQAMTVCLTRLKAISDDVYQRLCEFTIFEQNAKIPEEVLMTYWNKESKEQVFKIYKVLSDYSLMKMEPCSSTGQTERRYYIHSLLHVNLRRYVAKSALHSAMNYHRRFIERYLDRYPKGFASIDHHTDKYIFRYLAYHLRKAQLPQKIGECFLDLEFIIKKLMTCHSADTSYDFTIYGRMIEDYQKNSVNKDLINAKLSFHQFITRNSLIFNSDDLNRATILQRALLEGSNTAVYIQALEMAKKEVGWNRTDNDNDYSNSFFLLRCNKSHMYERILLCANVHTCPITFLQVVPTERTKFVLSAGNDGSVMLIDINTGEKRAVSSSSNVGSNVTCISARVIESDSNNNKEGSQRDSFQSDYNSPIKTDQPRAERLLQIAVADGNTLRYDEYLGDPLEEHSEPIAQTDQGDISPTVRKDSTAPLLQHRKQSTQSLPMSTSAPERLSSSASSSNNADQSPLSPADDVSRQASSHTVSSEPTTSSRSLDTSVSVVDVTAAGTSTNLPPPRVESDPKLVESEFSVCSSSFSMHDKQIYWCEISHAGDLVATASADFTVKIWCPNPPSAEPVTLTGHRCVVTCLSFSSNDHFLVSADIHQNCIVWKRKRGKFVDKWEMLETYRENYKVINILRSKHSKRQLMTSSETTTTVATSEKKMNPACLCFFIQGGRFKYNHVLSATVRGFNIWTFKTEIVGANSAKVTTFETKVRRVANPRQLFHIIVSRCGQFVAASLKDSNNIQVWDISAEPVYSILSGHYTQVHSLTFISDVGVPPKLLSGDEDGNVMMWNLQQLVDEVDPKVKPEFNACYSRDGVIVITISAEGAVGKRFLPQIVQREKNVGNQTYSLMYWVQPLFTELLKSTKLLKDNDDASLNSSSSGDHHITKDLMQLVVSKHDTIQPNVYDLNNFDLVDRVKMIEVSPDMSYACIVTTGGSVFQMKMPPIEDVSAASGTPMELKRMFSYNPNDDHNDDVIDGSSSLHSVCIPRTPENQSTASHYISSSGFLASIRRLWHSAGRSSSKKSSASNTPPESDNSDHVDGNTPPCGSRVTTPTPADQLPLTTPLLKRQPTSIRSVQSTFDITALAISHDSEYAALAERHSGFIKVRNARTKEKVQEIITNFDNGDHVLKLLFNSTDANILYAMTYRIVQRIVINTGAVESWPENRANTAYCEIACSNDGQFIAVAADRVEIFDAKTGVILVTVAHVLDHSSSNIETRPIHSICFSPKGTYLITGDNMGLVKIWPFQMLLNVGKKTLIVYCSNKIVSPIAIPIGASSKSRIDFLRVSPGEQFLVVLSQDIWFFRLFNDKKDKDLEFWKDPAELDNSELTIPTVTLVQRVQFDGGRNAEVIGTLKKMIVSPKFIYFVAVDEGRVLYIFKRLVLDQFFD